MAEQKHRERMQHGEFLTDAERILLRQTEQLLYPVACAHWDLAACFCPLCEAWRLVQKPLTRQREAELQRGADI